MTREGLIYKIHRSLSQLPDDKVKEVSVYIENLLQNHDEEVLEKELELLVGQWESFLKSEENIYSIEDLNERF